MEKITVANVNGYRTDARAPRHTVGIYTPYDLVPGGGEKYYLTIAEHLSRSETVYLVLDEVYSHLRLRSLGKELDLDLDRVKIVRYADIGSVAPFDRFIAVGNEIVPPVPAFGRESYFLCQFPFPRKESILVERRAYWDRYDSVLVYSDFVRQNVHRIAALNTLPEKQVRVLAPACFSEEQLPIHHARKHTILETQGDTVKILSVGRFFFGEHCKRHDTMIEALRDLLKLTKGGRGIELHLAGTLPPINSSREYYQQLLEMSQGLPVHFHLNIEIDKLEQLYQEATFYWHAAGILSDLVQNPETMEHFGIAVVEGMANGCVPLVVDKGGPADIVEDGISGVHFATRQELARKTLELLNDERRLAQLRTGALRRATIFSKEAFLKNLDAIFNASVVRAPV